MQTGLDATNIGNLTLQFDEETDEVISVNGFLQPVENLKVVDEDIQEQVTQYNEEMNEILNQVIGESTTGLLRTNYYSTDAPLGNFWTDAMRDHTGADIAFTNNGGMRADIEPGEVTIGDIYTVEPFENEIMTIEMTGAALKDVIEYSYSRRNQVDLQTAGLHYTILTDEEGTYEDATIEVDGTPLEEEGTYVVAISDFFGSGGSGYEFVGEVIEPLTGKMTEAMINYALDLTEQGEAIDYSHEGRIAVEVIEEDPIEDDPIGENPVLEPIVDAEITVTEDQVTISNDSIEKLDHDGTLIVTLPEDVDILEVNLTEEQLQQLVRKDAQIFIVRVNEVTLQFSASTFAENKQLSLKLERGAMENPLSAVYDFTISDGDTVISEFNDNITLIFTVNEEEVNDAAQVKLYRAVQENEWTALESEYENGLVIGMTDHFSTFTVFEEAPNAEEPPVEEEPAPTPPKNDRPDEVDDETNRDSERYPYTSPGERLPATATSMYNWMVIGLTLTAAGAGLFFYRKRKRNQEA